MREGKIFVEPGYDGIYGTDDDDGGDISLAISDDDEDGLHDEDGIESGLRSLFGGLLDQLPPGEGLDVDDDRVGVEDEAAKLNINAVGNLRGINNTHRHNHGVTTFEIDPTMYFMARGISPNESVHAVS